MARLVRAARGAEPHVVARDSGHVIQDDSFATPWVRVAQPSAAASAALREMCSIPGFEVPSSSGGGETVGVPLFPPPGPSASLCAWPSPGGVEIGRTRRDLEMARHRIRTRMLCALAAALALGAALTGPAAALKPAPTYTSVLTTDGACSFGLTATWPSSVKVGTVYGLWYLDGAFLLTTQAPGTGPNASTIKGRTATFATGPFTATTETHTWRVLTQFYSAAGAHLFEMDSNTITATCGIPTP
jgi:hypothetical protein